MTTAAPISAAYSSSNGPASASPYHSSSIHHSNSNMYSGHSSHHLHASGGSGYGSSTTSASGHHGSADSGLAPQSSFDTVPGSQHGSAMHQAPSSGASWGSQGMHYSGSANGSAYGGGAYGGAGGYYGSAGTQTPSGTVAGSGGASGYSGYGVQPHQAQSAGSSGMYSGHNGSASGLGATAGLNGNAAGSAHHSGSSTPTSQTPYHHQHPHSVGSAFPSPQGYPSHHQQGGYYSSSASGAVHGGASSNNVMSSPSYTSAPQYSTQLPLAGRHRVTTTLWEDEGTLCFQVDARGVCVARRHDNNMINGTKLLNVCGMSRGKRDGILKNEKERIVVKVGAMHLKGVWITFQRGKQLAEQNNILDVVYPLFETNIQSFLYHPDNYPRTAAVMAAAQERHAQRSRASLSSTDSPTGYARASSQTANGAPLSNAPPLMRSNTTPNNLASAGAGGYGHTNGYTSAPNHSPSGHMGAPPPHSMHSAGGGGGSGGGIMPLRSPVDRRESVTLNPVDNFAPYTTANLFKHRTNSGLRRGLEDGSAVESGFASGVPFDERV